MKNTRKIAAEIARKKAIMQSELENVDPQRQSLLNRLAIYENRIALAAKKSKLVSLFDRDQVIRIREQLALTCTQLNTVKRPASRTYLESTSNYKHRIGGRGSYVSDKMAAKFGIY